MLPGVSTPRRPARPISTLVLTTHLGKVPVPKAPVEYVPPPTEMARSKREQRARERGEEEVVPTAETAPDVIPEDEVAGEADLAATVTKKTLRRLASGELQPSIRDGLIAQQLLDRREEKAEDRRFMLSLAQALAGGGHAAPVALLPGKAETPDDVIEGYFEEVGLAPEHLRSE